MISASLVRDKVPANRSFKIIEDATAAAIEKARAGSLTSKEDLAASMVATKRIAGFDIEVPELKVEASKLTVGTLLKAAEKFGMDQAILQGEMSRAGIEPLAYLPTKAWEDLRRKAGLFTFHNGNENGTVNTEASLELFGRNVADKMKNSGMSSNSFWSMFWILFLSLAVPATHYLPEVYHGKVIIYFYLPSYVGALIFAAITTNLFESFLKSPSRHLKKALKQVGGIRKLYWPNQEEPYGGGDKVKVIFPTPPEEVKAVLLKAYKADMKMMTTLDSAAIGFAQNQFFELLQIVKKISEKHRQQEAERRALLRADPIVWTKKGSAVAILAQYGEFPIEKALVAEVMREFTFTDDDYRVAVF